MNLSYGNSSYPVCYFTSSALCMEPDKTQSELQITLHLHYRCLASQCGFWDYMMGYVCILEVTSVTVDGQE